MHCTVYPMRRNGQRLPPDVIRQHGHRGWLVVMPFRLGPVLYARLYSQQPPAGAPLDQLPFDLELAHVHLGKLNGGILLRGLEPVGQVQHNRQAWWVVPGG